MYYAGHVGMIKLIYGDTGYQLMQNLIILQIGSQLLTLLTV